MVNPRQKSRVPNLQAQLAARTVNMASPMPLVLPDDSSMTRPMGVTALVSRANCVAPIPEILISYSPHTTVLRSYNSKASQQARKAILRNA